MPEIRPNPGPQTQFLSSSADIAIYGGGAGGGKTFALLLDVLRNRNVAGFEGVVFRRVGAQITVAGGLWSESAKWYPLAGGTGFSGAREWRWPNRFRVSFRHMEDNAAEVQLQGAQIPFQGYDELTHFTREQFLGMLGRSRSMSGIPGRLRATCNPEPGWVKELIRWWLDEEGRYPDRSKAGKLRWFVRSGDELVWYATKDEAEKKHGHNKALSVTFIPALLTDNPRLLENDPSYLSKLAALGHVMRHRLEMGDWKIQASAGNVFRRSWFPVVPAAPEAWTRCIRYWDRAATAPNGKNDPDWTAGVKLCRGLDRRFYVCHVERFQSTPGEVRKRIENIARSDGPQVEQWLQTDPGQAGKYERSDYMIELPELGLRFDPVPKASKLARADAASNQSEAGNIVVVNGSWTDSFLTELENFPTGSHDDQVDGFSGAYNRIVAGGAWGLPPPEDESSAGFEIEQAGFEDNRVLAF